MKLMVAIILTDGNTGESSSLSWNPDGDIVKELLLKFPEKVSLNPIHVPQWDREIMDFLEERFIQEEPEEAHKEYGLYPRGVEFILVNPNGSILHCDL
uniref:Uncharacterized protein n=1 Tax=viral metagenome TaxID=1070528 RepID=A0A6M3KKT8_9ZZZZ